MSEPMTREQLEYFRDSEFSEPIPRELARAALAYLDRAEAAERERDALEDIARKMCGAASKIQDWSGTRMGDAIEAFADWNASRAQEPNHE